MRWSVNLFRTDVSEERITSIIRVEGLSELGKLAVTTDDGGDTFLQTVCSKKSYTTSHKKTAFFIVIAVQKRQIIRIISCSS
jgi:hypothetical protein